MKWLKFTTCNKSWNLHIGPMDFMIDFEPKMWLFDAGITYYDGYIAYVCFGPLKWDWVK